MKKRSGVAPCFILAPLVVFLFVGIIALVPAGVACDENIAAPIPNENTNNNNNNNNNNNDDDKDSALGKQQQKLCL